MRVWEASWDARGELLIWGEQADRAEDLFPRGLESLGEQTRSASSVFDHPFACPLNQLEKDLSALDFEADGSRYAAVVIPSDDIGPQASPALLPAREVERQGDTSLRTWRVPVLTLKPLSALGLLSLLPQRPPQGLSWDDSLLFWVETTKLVLDLMARGRYLPGIFRQNSGYRACWHMLTGDKKDLERMSVLASSIPPLCRALPADSSAHNEPGVLLESFVSCCGDALIRSFLRHSSLIPENLSVSQLNRYSTIFQWLRKLTDASRILEGPPHELAKLEQRLKRWGGRCLSTLEKPQLQMSFGLMAPQNDSMDIGKPQIWRVDFSVRSLSNDQNIISAHDIWRGELGFLAHSEYSLEDIEDYLLSSLGAAASAFPALDRALKTPFPAFVDLSAEEAYEFLKHTSRMLEQEGFSTSLPAWWLEPKARFGLHLSVAPRSGQTFNESSISILGTQSLLDFSWSLSLGDHPLSTEEFNALVEQHSPLINRKGQWVAIDKEQIDAALDFVKKQSKKSGMTLLEAIRFGFGLNDESISVPVVGLSASGWIKQLLERETHSIINTPTPDNFAGDLRPYQQEGLSWLAFLNSLGMGACLADDMGLGKTIQLLALLLHEREQLSRDASASSIAPTLLFVPMSIIENWVRETRRFAPSLTVCVHHGSSRLSGKAFTRLAEQADLVITTYSLAHRDETELGSIKWGRIAIDEAQNIKNLDTKQTQAIRRLMRKRLMTLEDSQPCHRVALTGTPLENRTEELWSIIDFLNPGFLGTLDEFREHFAFPIERYHNRKTAERLSRLIRPFVLRRLKTDPKVIQDLPEKIEIDVYTALSKEQAALYQAVVEDLLPQIDSATGIHRKGLVLATITKLKQICNHPSLFSKDGALLSERSGKLQQLEQLLEVILPAGDRVLVFTQFAQFGHLLKPYLEDKFNSEVLFLHGALPRAARIRVLDKFQQPDGPQIFLLSLKAGGFGLNLVQANQVIHLDQWWNPAVEQQATDRAYRIGQQRNVQVRRFVCKGTLEEKIQEMLQRKRMLAEDIVGSTKNMITELSSEELRQLLQFSGEGSLTEAT